MKSETIRELIVKDLVKQFKEKTKKGLEDYQGEDDVTSLLRDILGEDYNIYSSYLDDEAFEVLKEHKIYVDFDVSLENSEGEIKHYKVKKVELLFDDILQGPYHWEEVTDEKVLEKMKEMYEDIDLDNSSFEDFQDTKIYWKKD